MDSVRSSQDILLCDFCETEPLHCHCEFCNINLCIICVGQHLSDFPKEHNVVPYKHTISTPNYRKCPLHARKRCELYCEKCDTPICSTCVISGKHNGHDITDVLKKIRSKTQDVERDLEELESRICPIYQEMVYDIRIQKAQVETNYGRLTTEADQQGEILHREITAIVNQRKSEIEDMKNKHLGVLNKHIDGITHKTQELRQVIEDLKKMLNSKDVSALSFNKSRNYEFRRLPPKVRVTLPSFSHQEVNRDQLNEMYGSLSSSSIAIEEHGDTVKSSEAVSSPPVKPMTSSEAVSSPPVKPLIDEPQLTSTMDTGYATYSVRCLNEEQVWTRGENEIMKLVNLQGKLLTSVQTESGNTPQDIAVTRYGDLVYADSEARTIDIFKNKQIQTMITLQGWRPRNICSTFSDHLLVTMISDDNEQSKVVRFSGSTEKQTIQFDDHGRPLYSSDVPKYITENRNLDICVADYGAKAVVVVNQLGKLRFKYTGHPSNTKKSFDPVGITTDSQSHILIADCDNHRIHILDQNGQFLRYIKNCGLRSPWGLCVDIRDNLFVAGFTRKVKKIQYLSL